MCERIQDVVSDLWPEGLCYFQNLTEAGIALPVTNGPSLEISEGGREEATRVYSLRSMQKKKASALRP